MVKKLKQMANKKAASTGRLLDGRATDGSER